MNAARTSRWLGAPLAIAALLVVCAGVFAFWPWQTDAASDLPEPKSNWADYSWQELSGIGHALSSSEGDTAEQLAITYSLVDEQGVPRDVPKHVSLADGTDAWAYVADIRHDRSSDGGLAGLTFALVCPNISHAMNHAFENPDGEDADSIGGWAASDMRAWLASDFSYELPADMRSRIVPAQKRTANNVGIADELDEAGKLAGSAADWVSATSDDLWLFSAAELCGPIPSRSDLGVDATMSDVYNAEGSQYRLFAAADARAFEPCAFAALCDFGFGNGDAVRENASDACLPFDARSDAGKSGALLSTAAETKATIDSPSDHNAGSQPSNGQVKPRTWWLRTKTLEFANGFWLVGTDGTPLNGLGEDARVTTDLSFAPADLWTPAHARNLVLGFCL